MSKDEDNSDNESFIADEDFYDLQEESEEELEEEETEETEEKDTEAQTAARKLQKQEKLARKLLKPNSELILEAKGIWEDLRQKKVSVKERGRLMEKMMAIVRGKALDIIFKHDASRIIQCCIKYGSMDQRDEVAKELDGNYAKLSQSKYGRFIVSKILQYCSAGVRDAVMKDFHGKVRRMIRHKEASLVLDEAYSQFANSKQRNSLMEEFYGPEFAIFKTTTDGPRNLKDLIESQPLKKQYVLKYTRTAIDSVLEKAGFNVGKTPILHRAINEYLSVAEAKDCKDLIELLKDHLVHMLHTRDGCRVAQYCILHATPKDRKQIIKTFKGFVHSIAKEQYGHAVLLTCFECIDDTVLVSKALIAELFSPEAKEFKVNELMRDVYGSRVLLFLIQGRNRRFQPSYLINELEESDEVRATTTKKDPKARQQQLLELVSPLLIEQAALFVEELLRDKSGSVLLAETCNSAIGDVSSILEGVLKAIANGATGELLVAEEEASGLVHVGKKMKQELDLEKQKSQGLNMDESVLMGRSGTFAIKNLISKPKEASDSIPEWKADFVEKAWAILSESFIHLISFCVKFPSTTAGLVFIFVGLYEFGSSKICKEMKALIKNEKTQMLETVEKSNSENKAKVAAAKVGAKVDPKKRKNDDSRKTGLQILLSLL